MKPLNEAEDLHLSFVSLYCATLFGRDTPLAGIFGRCKDFGCFTIQESRLHCLPMMSLATSEEVDGHFPSHKITGTPVSRS